MQTGERTALRRALPFCLTAFLIGRVAFWALGYLGSQLHPGWLNSSSRLVARMPDHSWLGAITGYERYDALWYLQIASHGYDSHDGSAAYFPLYPLLTRLVGLGVGRHWLLAAYLVSSAALLAALVLLYLLTERELSTRAARATVVLLLCNPLAFFLYAPYTESLFLALSVGCFLALRTGHWPAAAVLAAFASATRSAGVLLALAMTVEAVHQAHVHGGKRRLLQRLGLSGLAVSGAAAYLLFWAGRGAWDRPLTAQHDYFHRKAALPPVTLVHGVEMAWHHVTEPGSFIRSLYALFTVIAVVLVMAVWRRTPPPYAAYYAASVAMPLSLAPDIAPLTSVPRYYLVLFPACWAIDAQLRNPVLRRTAIGISVTLGVLLSLLFVSWHTVL